MARLARKKTENEYTNIAHILYATQFDISDLVRKKGPTAIKCRFKTQLNSFSIWRLCNITRSSTS